MSPRLRRVTMPFWAGIFFVLVPRARRAVQSNLDQVAGKLGIVSTTRRAFRLFVNYAQALTDMYALHLGRPAKMLVHEQGKDHVEVLRLKGRGAVMLTGHMGAWQLAPFLMAQRDFPPFTMAMAEEPNRALGEFEARLREKFRIVYTTRSPFSSLELARLLRRGELVGMQLDRHLGGAGIDLPFCGRLARFPVGPAILARAVGCPLLPVFIMAEHRQGLLELRFCIEQPIDVANTDDRDADVTSATAKVVSIYEGYVRRYPEHWFNFYKFWPS